MKITINTDASFNKGIAAYAYWIETPDGTLKDSGLFADRIDNPSVAELLAFERAFRRIKAEWPDQVFDLTVNTDSMWVVKGLKGECVRYKGIYPRHVTLCKAVTHMIRDHQIQTVHIKSHLPRLKTAEQLANNWCDFTARELTRKEVGNRK